MARRDIRINSKGFILVFVSPYCNKKRKGVKLVFVNPYCNKKHKGWISVFVNRI